MARIEIVEHRAGWAGEFAVVARHLAAVAGDAAVRIDHIGSTAVPGLAAKDVVDVQVTVRPGELDTVAGRLHGAGFTAWRDVTGDHLPPGADVAPAELEKRLCTEPPGTRRVNVHVRVAGRANQRYALLCRDYLRSHPGAAAAYAEVKRVLARIFPDDVESYYDVKDPVFDLIMAGAEDWAAATGWAPPP